MREKIKPPEEKVKPSESFALVKSPVISRASRRFEIEQIAMGEKIKAPESMLLPLLDVRRSVDPWGKKLKPQKI